MEETVKEKQVKTDNELIAEFMGFVPRESEKYGRLYKHPDLAGEFGEKAMQFRYDTSWNDLMPVWTKFRQSCWNTIGYTTEFLEFKEDFMNAVFKGDCLKAQSVMVRAIKWYNTQTLPPIKQ